MTTFFIDLWQDLREKRLWPVAVGLVAATVAVPFMLFKPTSSPPSQPPLPSAARGPQLPVVSVDNGPLEGSRLSQFTAKNPFVPLAQLAASQSAATGSKPAQASSPGATTVSSASSSSSSGGASPAHVSAPSGGGSSSAPSNPSTASPGMHYFRYTADFKFGAPSHLKDYKGVKALSLLPNEQNPVVVFMGATPGGGSVVFFIDDPSYSAHGKGHCNAPGDACRFVTLTTSDNSETFTSADGQGRYKVVLDKINRVFFNPTSSSNGSKVSAAANDSTTAPDMLSLTGIGQALPDGGSQG